MNERTFFNPHMAQTLVSLQMLLYLNAAFALLGALSGAGPLALLVVAAFAGAAYGIANEQRWGYYLSIAVVVLVFGLMLLYLAQGGSVTTLLGFPGILEVMFDVVLAVLVFHPQSREYQRIWFK
ncbi:MAG: hypothetical protein U0V73_11790 [Acidimicrobiia bacterium]